MCTKKLKLNIMKEFKITEEQIKENKDSTLKEYFKEVFETKLEVGKWYKSVDNPRHIFCVEKLCLMSNRYYYYDINSIGEYKSNDWYSFEDVGLQKDFILATEEEVFDALKKEVGKRYKIGQRVKCLHDEDIQYIDCIDYDFWAKENILWINGNCLIFENGKWAEIIEQPEEIIELNGVKYKRID